MVRDPPRPAGVINSTIGIRLNCSADVQLRGVAPDGRRTTLKRQTFHRVTREVARHEVLLNPVTGEVHRVLSVEPLLLTIQTAGGARDITWHEARDLLVVR